LCDIASGCAHQQFDSGIRELRADVKRKKQGAIVLQIQTIPLDETKMRVAGQSATAPSYAGQIFKTREGATRLLNVALKLRTAIIPPGTSTCETQTAVSPLHGGGWS